MKQRLLSLILCIVMLVTGVPVASAAGDHRGWSQGDSPWGAMNIGTSASSSTMQRSGCVITCLAVAICESGLRTAGVGMTGFTPGTFLQELKEKEIVTSSGAMRWSLVSRAVSGFRHITDSTYYTPSSSFSYFPATSRKGIASAMEYFLQKGYSIILEVPGAPQHYVTVLEVEEDTVYIQNPSTGTVQSLFNVYTVEGIESKGNPDGYGCCVLYKAGVNSAVPEKPRVYTDRKEYATGEAVTIRWNEVSNNINYWISIHYKNNLIVDKPLGNATSYVLEAPDAGDYKVYLSANNENGTSGPSSCAFTVSGRATTVGVWYSPQPLGGEISTFKAGTTAYLSYLIYDEETNEPFGAYFEGDYAVTAEVFDPENQLVCRESFQKESGSIAFLPTMKGTYTAQVRLTVGEKQWHGSASMQVSMEVGADTCLTKGEEPAESFYVGEEYAFCYKLYDPESGALFNTFHDGSAYPVELRIYDALGELATLVLDTQDVGALSFVPRMPGPHRAEIVFLKEYRAEKHFSVGCMAELSVDEAEPGVREDSPLYLVAPGGCYSYEVRAEGQLPEAWHIEIAGDVHWLNADWTAMEDCYLLHLTAKEAGSGTVRLQLVEDVSGTAMLLAERTLYISAEGTTVEARFDPGEGQCDTAVKMVDHGSPYGELPTPIRESFVFDGWYLDGQRIESDTIVTQRQPHTLIAQWQIKDYAVSYDAGEGTDAPEEQTKIYNEPLTLSEQIPLRFGYNFIGWTTEKNGAEPQYQPGDSYTENAAMTLYAIWREDTIHTTTSLLWAAEPINGSCCFRFVPELSASYRISGRGELPGIVTLYDGNGTVLGSSAEEAEPMLQYMLEAGFPYYIYVSKSFMAMELSVGYTVKYDANGGENAPEQTWKYHGHTLLLSMVTPVKESEAFLGWNTEADGSGTMYSSGSAYAENSAVTLYAQWKSGCEQNGHSYVVQQVSPTCEVAGCLIYACSVCGHSYRVETKPPVGHSYIYTPTAVPNFTAPGILTGSCRTCGGTVHIELPILNTVDYSYIIMEKPNCIQKGRGRYAWRIQTYGRFLFDVTLPKTEHSYEEITIPPTCTTGGSTTHRCTICGDVSLSIATEPTGHQWDEGTLIVAPTEESSGEMRYICTVCGEQWVEELPPLEHAHVYTAQQVEPTCTEPGYVLFCCACGDSYQTEEEDPLGHDWQEQGTPEDGKVLYLCLHCGATELREHEPSCPSAQFEDVPGENHWSHAGIDFVLTHGLFKGMSDTTFEPDSTMTRAMLVTVLWRYAGKPKLGENTFTDVPNGKWYTKAVCWAAAEGVVKGISEGCFDPEGEITREQLATILYRYAKSIGADLSPWGDLEEYADAQNVAQFAKKAMQWAVGAELIRGMDGMLMPKGNATRAQVAAILMRFVQSMNG